jgi:hypothetical protein
VLLVAVAGIEIELGQGSRRLARLAADEAAGTSASDAFAGRVTACSPPDATVPGLADLYLDLFRVRPKTPSLNVQTDGCAGLLQPARWVRRLGACLCEYTWPDGIRTLVDDGDRSLAVGKEKERGK